ncbi:hypothetical protein [Mesorhizobium sp.]|uniref:hypothetical protein n=1 Tax=Mesorhizobium sp. TaxID=1871066 RepID=UPI0025F2AAA3|nr:hypothetical protein [Mesorhizobium sp.]
MPAPTPLTPGKNFEEFRDELTAARDGGQPWFVLGELYSQALATAADADLPALRTAASEASRLSGGVLRRYVVLLNRLRAIAASEGLTRDALLSRVFNAAEVAARIYDLDPEKGMTALMDLKAGAVTLEALRGRLAKIPVAAEPEKEPEPKRKAPSPQSVARGFAVVRSRELKAGFMLQALEARAAELWAPDVALRRRPGTRFYTSHQGFEIVAAGTPVRRLGGVELFILDGQEESELRYFEGVFPSYLVLATFYPRFDLAFSPSTPDASVARAVDLLGRFGAPSIGVLRVTSDGGVDVLVEPKGPPVPDRTARYDVLTQ